MKKRDFEKFQKRNTHKRRAKDKAQRELLSMVNSVYPSASVKLKDSLDLGRGARSSAKPRRDERVTEGVFSSSRFGFGFVTPIDGGRDIFIPEGKCSDALDGDLVSIIYHTYKNAYGEEKTEGRVTKILNFGRRSIIGTVEETVIGFGRRRMRTYRLLPDDGKFYPLPYITDLGGAVTGDKVMAKLCRGGYELCCEVERVFGQADSRVANYEAILADEGIITDFSPEELREAEEVASESVSSEGREVFRAASVFTIDGIDALDLDDAVSVCRTKSGWSLGVHIADVSHYVKPKTPLDRAATARATSVYFTDKVVPMLPKALSNGACSLNAGEDKYALSAIISLSESGEILSLKLKRTVIRSRVRGVYSEVNAIFDGTADKSVKEKYRCVLPSLLKMHELYLVLRARRLSRSYIDFDTDEAKILLDEDGNPTDVVLRRRADAEKMIEEFMLTANEAVATYMKGIGAPMVYRIHEPPPADKYTDFVRFVHNLGFNALDITSGDPCAEKLADLLEKAKEKELFYPVSHLLL